MRNFENAIYRNNQIETQNNNQEEEEKYYTVIGLQDFLDEDQYPRTNKENKNIYAKCSVNEEGKRIYLIKIGRYNKIFNPFGMYSEGKSEKFLSKIGKAEFVFKRVNQNIFDLYINFLKTRNIAWLNNAERGL
jgi:hypothetical protein